MLFFLNTDKFKSSLNRDSKPTQKDSGSMLSGGKNLGSCTGTKSNEDSSFPMQFLIRR